ncbi:hypothetical protein GGTG_14068 [Gaeumannomyces tritici R3-111a-1]|uniref:Uncharacterized protein n=1 Tax=Gaeumannomyces tritici (strain R3-111a-1) TaxID=644352 RepID=J3PKK8_GAET3|nr:hypothetical protein GGTG_14068 [Gaeumannomyces tritici R3-111a-1]EJT68354.1 hypothetical protein GGTG_14068 [Gaeumannomyces tritici R3-111a-1]
MSKTMITVKPAVEAVFKGIMDKTLEQYSELRFPDPVNPSATKEEETGTKEEETGTKEEETGTKEEKKELLESLQRRVADYERQGAQATLEMQQAAHAVAVENRRLRGLLAAGGIKRKLEEACPADLGDGDAQQSGGSDCKGLNREQLAVSPADTVKACCPSVRIPAKYVIPSDASLGEEKEGLATIPPEPAACCGPKVCGVPVTVELEPRHPSPQPLPQAVSCCSTLPSQAISCCGADADGPLQTRSVFQTACEDAAALLMEKRGENADATDRLEIRSALGRVGPGTCQVKYTTVLELLDKFTV